MLLIIEDSNFSQIFCLMHILSSSLCVPTATLLYVVGLF